MTDRAITRFIDVEVTKSNSLVSAAGFGTLLIITNSTDMTDRTKTFTSA